MSASDESDLVADSTPEPVDAAWSTLEAQLATYVATMIAPDEGDHLILELAGDDDNDEGCAPYVQVAGFGGGTMLRVGAAGNSVLTAGWQMGEAARDLLRGHGWTEPDEDCCNWSLEEGVDQWGYVASQIVNALRNYFGIAHPELLTQRAWGQAAEGAATLGLLPTLELPADVPLSGVAVEPAAAYLCHALEVQVAYATQERDALVALVGVALRERLGHDAPIDADGDFVLEHLEQPVFVRVLPDQPAVRVFARVTHEIRSRRATAVELCLLNRDHLWLKWELVERSAFQTVTVPAQPFVPHHLDRLLDLFLQALSQTRGDLSLRTGGRVA